MATLASTLRLSARVVCRTSRRGFRTAAVNHAAQNFTMPALSPTMTEGNIASWKVKEGDSFSAGDVLLEIETDKAQMDVEAQEDGVLAKITVGDGSKSVKVGSRIAVLAEEGDDLSSLDIPPEQESKQAGQPARKDRPTPQEETAGGIDPTESSESAAEGPPSSKPNADAAAGGAADTTKGSQAHSKPAQGGKTQKQKYPLYPSVQHLLHQKGLSKDDADKIPASGPQGRLLKGDVLAYLGSISKDYPAESSNRIQGLSHLDLSNIQLKTPEPKRSSAPAKPDIPAPPPDTEIAMPISLSAVIATQKRVQDTLDIFLPLSTFIARASELANDTLPIAKGRKPTADDLFNSILGLDKAIARTSRGAYTPQITALNPAPVTAGATGGKVKKSDIIDMLAAAPGNRVARGTKTASVIRGATGIAAADNVFSVIAKQGEEKRVQEYLGRMKTVLEKEPGRLVL